jgi:hypothetical protein
MRSERMHGISTYFPLTIARAFDSLSLTLWAFFGEARYERRRRTGSLSERRGRHVTHPFLRAPPGPTSHPWWFKEPLFYKFTHPPAHFNIFSGPVMGPGSESHQSLREGPPTRRERASDTHTPHFRSRSTSCSCPIAVQAISIPKHRDAV